MIKLVYNELYKIFHKKTVYIYMIVLAILFCLVGKLYQSIDGIMEYVDQSDYDYVVESIENYKAYPPETESDKYNYADALASRDVYDFIRDNNIDKESAKYLYVLNDLRNLYMAKYYFELGIDGYYYNGFETKEEVEVEIEKLIKGLDNYDELTTVKDMLKNFDEEDICYELDTESCKKYKEVYKKTLEYRLEHNIPIANNEISYSLEQYASDYQTFLSLDKRKDNLNKEQKEDYNSSISSIKVFEYKLDHNLIEANKKENHSAEYIAQPLTDFLAFIIISIILISSTIVSEEFDKGTIKQLLVKPFSRNKIIISKVIAAFLMILFFILFTGIINLAVCYIFIDNFDISATSLVYNSALGKVIEYNGFELFGLYTLYNMFYFVIFMLIMIFLSTLILNGTITSVIGFVLLIAPSIMSAFIYKVKLLGYLPLFTWKMTDYMFGGSSAIEVLNFSNQLAFNIFYLVLFFVLTLIVFKRKDIKNQ